MVSKKKDTGFNTNLTIGGKTYKSQDISRLTEKQTKPVNTIKGTENTPRDISKPLENQAGKIKTNIEEKTENRNINSVNLTAGRVPIKGSSLGAAYFTTLAGGQHNSLKSNINISSIETTSTLNKDAQIRAEQAILKGNYTPTNIIKNTNIEAKASFYEAIGHYNSQRMSLSQNVKNIGSFAAGKAQETFQGHDDMGSQTASGAISAGSATYVSFKIAQKASPIIINATKNFPTKVVKTKKGIVSVGKGMWDVTTTVGKATVMLTNTAQIMTSNFVPFNAQMTKNVLLHQVKITGLLHTATSKHIINRVKQVQNTTKSIKTGVVTATNIVKRSYNLVRNGNVMTSVIAHEILQKAGMRARAAGLKSLKLTTQGITRGAVKGSVWTIKTAKGIGSLSTGLNNGLNSSDDMMLQGLGNAMKLTEMGIKTSISTARVTGHAVKTGAKAGTKTVKETYKAINFVRQKSLRAIWVNARSKLTNSLAQAGRSTVSAVINLVRAAGTKIIFPVILIAVVLSGIMGLFSAPTVSVSGIFGGTFDTKNADGTYTETDIRDYLTNVITPKRNEYASDLYDYMQSQLESYEFVYFRTNEMNPSEFIIPSIQGIKSKMYNEEELANIIQPIFNALILKDYHLSATEAQSKAAFEEIFDSLFRITEEAFIEYCTDDDCEGHSALMVTMNIDGIYELLDKYFESPIDALAGKIDKTEAEERELSNLKDYYEICLEYINQVSETYGGGLTMEDLSGVAWVDGTRVGNQAIIDLALLQVGQIGGQPYWSWYGFPSRVEWCACFVSWCMNQVGRGEVKYSSCQYGGIPYFQSQGLWANSDYTDLVAGDVIFFDWDGDGHSDHTGLELIHNLYTLLRVIVAMFVEQENMTEIAA